MNPGKVIDPVAVYDPTENLRLGAGYQSPKPETFFQFPAEHGSFGEATLRCVGVGACRKETTGTMCPSYMATREERHSTRGRAHLLWEMMEGKILPAGSQAGAIAWKNDAVQEALDLCLSCKACKTECPVNVDMATYKAEFLAHYYQGRLATTAALRLRLHGPPGPRGFARAGSDAAARQPAPAPAGAVASGEGRAGRRAAAAIAAVRGAELSKRMVLQQTYSPSS